MQRTSPSNHLSTGPLPAVVAAQGATAKPTGLDNEHQVPLDADVPGTQPQGAPAPQPGLLMQVLSKLNCCPSLPEARPCPDGKAVRQCLGKGGVAGITAGVATTIFLGVPFMLTGHMDEYLGRAGLAVLGGCLAGTVTWAMGHYVEPHCA